MKQSVWEQLNSSLSFSELEQDSSCDVCIIGSGLCGLYTAYLLAKRGLNVILVEGQSTIGGVATKRSTGKLSAQHGAIYQQLSEQEQLTYYKANESSINRFIEKLPISCYEKVTSYLYSNEESGVQKLQQEFACYKQLPFKPISTNEIELPIDIKLAIGMPNMYQVNPVLLTNELTKLATQAGVSIYTNTRITKVDLEKKAVMTSNDVWITPKHLVINTHYPIESIRNLYTVKLRISRSYLSAVKTFDPISNHYLGIDKNGRTIRTAIIENQPYLLLGGGSHIAGTVSDVNLYYDPLLKDLKDNFHIDEQPIMWSSQDIETPDSLPYIGRVTKDDNFAFIATGFKKWGLSTSLVAAEILDALISNETHAAQLLFDSHRTVTSNTYVQAIAQAGFVTEQLISSYAMRMNAPKCTHLGCKTRWNEEDQTYDCPCHGSRFSADGHVVEGPAVYPLNFE